MNAGAPDMQIMTSAHATVFAAARRPSLAQLLASGGSEEIGANLVGMLASAHPRTAGGIALPRALWHMLYAMVAARVELRDRLGRPLTWVSLRADLKFERYIALALDANLSGHAVAALDEHLAWLGVEPRHLEWLLTAPATGGLDAPVARELARLRQRHDHCVSVLLGGGELPRWATTGGRRSTVRRSTTVWMAAVGAALLAVIAQWPAARPVAYGVTALLVVAGAAAAWAAVGWVRHRRRAAAAGEPLPVGDPPPDDGPPADDIRPADGDLTDGGSSTAVERGRRPAAVGELPLVDRLSLEDQPNSGEPRDSSGAPTAVAGGER